MGSFKCKKNLVGDLNNDKNLYEDFEHAKKCMGIQS